MDRMRRALGAIALASGMLVAGMASAAGKLHRHWYPTAVTTSTAPIGLLVPAYFHPSGTGATAWNRLAQAARKAPLVVIVNPSNGPGVTLDTRYRDAIAAARAAGAKMIGYVHTSYTARPLADVTRDIELWRAYYPLDGFFVDEMSNAGTGAQLLYYSSIYQYVKALDARYTVIGNPGTDAAESYMSLPATDVLVNFEWTAAAYKTYKPAAYMATYGPARQAHLVHDADPRAAPLDIVDTARSRGAGWVYVTDDRGASNPWDRLPVYWDDLVRRVCKVNTGRAC